MSEVLLTGAVESAEAIPEAPRRALRDLLLTLADNKRLLGIRYSDWMLGAPSLETGIAASSMAQDEWGHGRLTYALLSDFGDDPKSLEHEREAEAYHSMEVLDVPLGSWAELIAAGLVLDTALTLQYDALLPSRYAPVHNRVQKLLDEEAYHFQYAAGWVERLAAAPGAREPFREAVQRYVPVALRWFGRGVDDRLTAEGLVGSGPDALRDRLRERIEPVLRAGGVLDGLDLGSDPDWEGWNTRRRRTSPGGPDPATLARVRGDRNRAMLLD